MDIEFFKATIKDLQQLRKDITDNPYTKPERRLFYFEKLTVAIEALFDMWLEVDDD